MNTVLNQAKIQAIKKRSTFPFPTCVSPSPRPRLKISDDVFNELVDELFTPFPRSDQRGKGFDYLLGLLYTPGRKSIRNMATLFGDAAVGQSLHHFICSSTWEWEPVRQRLARYLVRRTTPRAWVVRPLVIPKGGRHSVGVVRYFSDDEGQVINAQRAVGVWLASEQVCVPVEWSLHLPGGGGGLPRDRGPLAPHDTTLASSAMDACLRMSHGWNIPPQPVILDLGEVFPAESVLWLKSAGLLPIARVSDELQLRVADPALTGHGGQQLSAHRIMLAARELRRPVLSGPNTSSGAGRHASLSAAVRVNDPNRPGEQLTLVGSGTGNSSWPDDLWLTTLARDQAVAAAAGARKQVSRVERSLSDVSDRVGIRDYAGRSYNGWHRHITLASAAHAVSALSV